MFTFDQSVPLNLQNLITNLNKTRARVRVWYGDINTGTAWPEEFEVLGYIGRSTGQHKIPLLVNNARSYGGGALLVSSIVRIDTTCGRVLYKHPTFEHGITLEGLNVYAHGALHARCKTESQAAKLAAFLIGERYSK